MNNTSTNFSYFLPRHHFCSIETMEIYPRAMRPGDPELSVDKAMTMLNIAEDQIIKMISAEPFNPEEFGFIEREVQGESEFDTETWWHDQSNMYSITASKQAMKFEILKLRSIDEHSTETSVEWSISAFIPNRITGAILLQSLGIIELMNPSGVYVTPTVEQLPPQEEPEGIDKTLPVLIFAPQTFTDPKEQDEFFEKNGIVKDGKQVRHACILNPGALEAMRQIRFVIQEKENGMNFEGVEAAINEHPNMSTEQKSKMIIEWNGNNFSAEDQQEGSEAPVKEEAPTE